MKQLNFFDKDELLTRVTKKPANQTNPSRLERKFAPRLHEDLQLVNLFSYAGNKNIPAPRIYGYKEAFALSFVEELISYFGLNEKDYIFDPCNWHRL